MCCSGGLSWWTLKHNGILRSQLPRSRLTLFHLPTSLMMSQVLLDHSCQVCLLVQAAFLCHNTTLWQHATCCDHLRVARQADMALPKFGERDNCYSQLCRCTKSEICHNLREVVHTVLMALAKTVACPLNISSSPAVPAAYQQHILISIKYNASTLCAGICCSCAGVQLLHHSHKICSSSVGPQQLFWGCLAVHACSRQSLMHCPPQYRIMEQQNDTTQYVLTTLQHCPCRKGGLSWIEHSKTSLLCCNYQCLRVQQICDICI